MKSLFSTFTMILLISSMSSAEMKSVIAIMKKATVEEQKDLQKLLSQVTLVPIKDVKSGITVFKITSITKGSVYDREGLKVGDLVLQ